MASPQCSKYSEWNVAKLKIELSQRGATTSGRKQNLIERLESYDRNKDFRGEPIILPDPLDPDWPVSGFQQLQGQHKIHFPRLNGGQIEGFFQFRIGLDRQLVGDIQALEKGRKLFDSRRVFACSVNVMSPNIFLSGVVGAAMKKHVSYNYKIKLDKMTGEVQNSHCECPAGKGPHGTCKHIAAALIMVEQFVETGISEIQKTCTEDLQSFHVPKKAYQGSPVKSEFIPCKKKCSLDDPRPQEFVKMKGYQDHVRNAIINYCSTSSKDIAMRYLFPKADIQTASIDHLYLKRPFTEYWVDKALEVTSDSVKSIEKATRLQQKSRQWTLERRWRITASRFGEICRLTDRCNREKLCASFHKSSNLTTAAILHGKKYESTAITKFEERSGLVAKKAGLFILQDKPFLGASPDGVIDEETIIEVKCPFSGRRNLIRPGKYFPYLEYDDNDKIVLKQNSKYYDQVQGQLFISGRKKCYFIVYTHEDLLWDIIYLDEHYCKLSMIPKLEAFYNTYLRKYLASKL